MTPLQSSAKVHQHILNRINPYAEEVWLISLNSHFEETNTTLIFRGTAHFCTIHCRDIFRQAIMDNAVSFILIHNHPSGNPLPSYQDIQFTKKLFRLAKMMEIPLADHVIVTSKLYFSMADGGMLDLKRGQHKKAK